MVDYSMVENIVRKAGEIMKSGIGAGDIFVKGRADFVTKKDLEVQRYIFCRTLEVVSGDWIYW